MKCKVCGNLLYGYETTCPDCGHKVEEQKRTKPYTLLSKRTLTTLMNRELPSETRGAYTHLTLSCAIAITALLLCLSLFYHVPPPAQANTSHVSFSFIAPQALHGRQGTIARATGLLVNTGNVQLQWKIVVDHTTPPFSLSIRAGTLLPQANQLIIFTIKTQHLALGSHILAFQMFVNNRGYKKTSIALFVLPTPPPDTSNGVKNAASSYSPPIFKPTPVPEISPTTPLSPPKHTAPQPSKQLTITPTASAQPSKQPTITPTPTPLPSSKTTPTPTIAPATPSGSKPGMNPASQQDSPISLK